MATVHIIWDMKEVCGRTMKSQPKDVGSVAAWWKCVLKTFKGTKYHDMLLLAYHQSRVSDTHIKFALVGNVQVIVDRKRAMLTA